MKKCFATPETCIAVTDMPSIEDTSIRVHEVPLLTADEENFSLFGHFVRDYDKEKVIIETWPRPGWRPIEPGTGDEGGIAEGLFHFERKGALMLGKNEAVEGYYITGWFADPAVASEYFQDVDYSRVLVREANYHPDGGQVFFPIDGCPFVILVAAPGDDVTPVDFLAFYINNGAGVQIKPNVWHQPVFPLSAKSTFWGKQGKVHACVACDMVAEFHCYLSVPMPPAP